MLSAVDHVLGTHRALRRASMLSCSAPLVGRCPPQRPLRQRDFILLDAQRAYAKTELAQRAVDQLIGYCKDSESV